MNDFEVMQKARLKWVREMATAGRPMPTEVALAAYHRAFFDALEVALGRVIAEERLRDAAAAQAECGSTPPQSHRSSTTGDSK